MSYGQAARMAGQKLLQFLSPGKMNTMEAVMRFGPDLAFGALAATQSPGDAVDKGIAGLSVAAPSLLGGLAAGGAVRALGKGRMDPDQLGQLIGAADLVGSIGGDFVGYPAGQQLLRAKDALTGGKGETPFERMSAKQQKELAAQMRAQVMSEYGLIPGTRSDDYLAQLGIG